MRLLLRSTFRIFDCAEDRSLRKNANKSAFASGLFVPLANVMNETFSLFLWAMTVLALAVFVALHFVEAGYGYLFNRKFGPGIPNRIGSGGSAPTVHSKRDRWHFSSSSRAITCNGPSSSRC